jgi:hypothetical protein
MDIGYRKYVNEYVDFIDNISNVIDIALYNNMDKNIDDLLNDVLIYVHDNFPSILVSHDEFVNKIKEIYIQKTDAFKRDVDFRKASVKYDLNGCFSLPKIREYIEKGNKDFSLLFKSVTYGTNVSYCDTVVNISSEIFGTIQRSSNNNLMFAKKTKETQEYIDGLVLKYYRDFMKSYGEELIKKGLNPMEVLYESIKNYVEVSNKDIIDDYSKTMIAT